MPRLPLLLLLWGTSSYAFPVFQEGHRQDVETVWVNGSNITHGGNASLDFVSFWYSVVAILEDGFPSKRNVICQKWNLLKMYLPSLAGHLLSGWRGGNPRKGRQLPLQRWICKSANLTYKSCSNSKAESKV